jgi:iron(III) transport system permease protein
VKTDAVRRGGTSRPLVGLATLGFVLAGLAPIACMLGRLGATDLVGVLDARTTPLLLRTCGLGLGAAGLALALGLPFGFLVARTDLPGARFLRHVGMVPLLVPPVILAMTTMVVWTDLGGGTAVVLVLGVSTFPLVAVFAGRALERIDARREQAALLAGGLRAAIAMELPLVLPAALCGACFAFVLAINDFAVPDYVASIGKKYNVYADEIFASWQSVHAPGKAVAAALPLLVLTLMTLIPALWLRRRGSLATFDGDFQRPGPLALGRGKWPAFALAVLVVGLTALFPLGRLLWESGGGAAGWSLDRMRAAFARGVEVGRADLQRSLLFAGSAALLSILPALVLGHALERARKSAWLETWVVLPIAVPAILFGIGYIALWNHAATAELYSSGFLVVLLLLGRFLSFPILAVSGATAMLDRRLEQAAVLAGSPPARRLLRIVEPAVRTSLLGGSALVFVFGMRELDAAILVPAANGTAMFRVYNAIHFGRDDFVAALALLVIFFILLPGILWSAFARSRMELLP